MFTTNQITSSNNQKRAVAILALSMIMWTGQASLAQGLQAGPMGTLSPSSALGPDQESLLPPEVVPLDPAVANAMSQSQAQSRAASMSMPQAQGTPGMVGGELENKLSGMHSAQDARKAALDSLMGQGQYNPAAANMAPSMMNNNALGQSPLISSSNGGTQLGQSPLMKPGQSPAMVNNNVANHSQSQTLTGGVKYKPVRRDIKRGGMSNAISAIAGFGSGMFVGSLVRRPNTAFGLGMFGLGLSGFGTRNGFRF